MTINKDLLVVKPEKQETIAVPEKQYDEIIKTLLARIEVLEKQVEVLAGFEMNMIKAFNNEIELLNEASSTTQSESQKSIFRNLRSSLERILGRWSEGYTYIIDRKKMSIERI